MEYSKFDKGVMLTTAAVTLDYVVGELFGSEPLHQMLGLNSPNFTKTLETLAIGLGVGYILFLSKPARKYTLPTE